MQNHYKWGHFRSEAGFWYNT